MQAKVVRHSARPGAPAAVAWCSGVAQIRPPARGHNRWHAPQVGEVWRSARSADRLTRIKKLPGHIDLEPATTDNETQADRN